MDVEIGFPRVDEGSSARVVGKNAVTREEDTLKTKIKIAALSLVGIPAYLLTLNKGLSLLNEPNDALVYIGYVMLLAVAAATVYIGIRANRRFLRVAAVVAISGIGSGCAYTTIEPGHVGIKVEQTGSQRGVQDFPVKTGRVWYNPVNEFVLDFNTSVQQYTWTKDKVEGRADNEEMCFKSSDFLIFCADVNAAFKVIDEKAPQFYVQFRNDDIDKFVHGFFRNVIRDSLTKYATLYSADDLNGAKQDEMLIKVTDASRAELLGYGVNLIKLGFAHPPRPPEQIQKAINLKLEAVQNAIRTENELRQTEAEAKKKIAEAEGKAKANQAEILSITPQLLQMRALEKWDGKLPVVNGSGGSMILDLSALRK